ncbi:multidrug ABC transporter [Brevibacillus laterosporus]|uniref:efflux RND transporter permease subunit n=1 Tax=Brevibacillus laterosporus TaxID=1465 RepID=UPI000CE41B45|nr:efflux RND transporter permease subunit [Brevibacillus laterosporus]PPA82006.1 multidrug ABC transporter [Brevibacillus laterosporus]
MNISRFAINRPVTILMLAVAVLIFGFVSLPKLAVELYPNLNLPVAVVVTSVEGGTPASVEKLVTKPVEEALGTVPNVSKISSFSMSGASQVIVQFNWGTNMDQATLNMRDKVDQVRGALPDTAKSPRVLKLDPNSEPIMTFALTGSDDITKLKELADNVIKSRIERIDGVASVGVNGGKERIIEVTLDADRITAYGITLEQVQQALMGTNLSGAAGMVREGDKKLSIRVQGEYTTIKDIGETPVVVGPSTIPLKNIAFIEDTYKEQTQFSYYNGKPTVGISVTKASGGNTIKVADSAKIEIEKLKENLPPGTEISMITDSSQFIKDSIYTVAEHALIGAAFSTIILLLFLNSVRSVLIIAVVIPISVIATFCLMFFTNQTINLISLSGLTLGLGSLVDFAVVILENIFRHRQEGKSMLQAARYGSQEVGTAVMASALAQICVFLPIMFVEGLASQLFGPLALTVVYSHIAALLASITLVPMMSARILKRIPDEEIYHSGTYRGFNPITWFNIGFTKISNFYGGFLKWAIKWRKTVYLAVALMFAGAVVLTPFIGAEFIPSMDQGKITVAAKLANNTQIQETEKVISELEGIVKKVPELKELYVSIGSAGASVLANSATNRGELQLTLVDTKERTRTTDQVIEDLRNQVKGIPGAEITVKHLDGNGGMGGTPLEISLRGDDLDVLDDISNIILGVVNKVPGTANVTTSLEEKDREFQVVVDREKASQYGLSTQQVLSYVRTAFEGQTLTRYQTGDDEVDVKVRLPKSIQDEPKHLERLTVTTPSGAQVSIGAIAKVEKVEVAQMVKRADQTREVSITGDTSGRDLNSIMTEVQGKLAQLNLPDGYHIEYGGQSKDMEESFGSLGLAILLSIVLVYMVMASQFESLFSPFIIMFSVPPTFIGVVVGLFVTGQPLSVPALIGYILLVGIVVNNAIVLMDYIITARKDGLDRDEAILKAGPIRLRPIMMTTLATVLAITPLAFAGGSGNESQAPMAVVVIFGLTFSTLITLVLVPVVYVTFDNWGRKFKNRFNRKKKNNTPTVVEEV